MLTVEQVRAHWAWLIAVNAPFVRLVQASPVPTPPGANDPQHEPPTDREWQVPA